MALAGKQADVKITATAGTTSNNEAFSLVAGTSATYQVTASARRHLDKTVTVTGVLDGASTVAPADYTVIPVQGRLVFGSTVVGPITADLTYLTASSVAGGREWQLNVEQDLFEISQFGSSGWKEYITNIVGAQVTIGRYWSDSTMFDLLNTDSTFIVELLPNSTGYGRYEGYAYVTQDSVATPVDGVVGESVSLVIDGALYYTTE